MRYCFLLCVACYISFGQTKDTDDGTDQIGLDTETMLGDESGESDDSELAATLDRLEEHPLDINTANADELGQIPGLDDLLIARILKRRSEGKFASVRELRKIEGVSASLFRILRRCLVVRKGLPRGSPLLTIRSRTRSATQPAKGDLQRVFSGSRIKSYNKVSLRAPVRIGDEELVIWSSLTTEKDAGERMGDFVSEFIEGRTSSFRMIAGDYLIESGAGLVFPRKYSTTGGADVLEPARLGTRVSGYTSAEENFFFRGVFAEVRFLATNLGLFVSRKPINGTVDSSGSLVSLDQSGLFRTESERKHKGAANQTTFGGLADLSLDDRLMIGLKSFVSSIDHPLSLGEKSRARSAGALGLDARYRGSGWMLFGEIARNQSKALAAQGGFQFEPDRTVDLLVAARVIPTSFENVFHVTFSNESERGVYAALAARLPFDMNVRCSLNRRFDRWNNPTSPFPISHDRFYAGLETDFDSKTECNVEYRSAEEEVRSITDGQITDYRSKRSVRVTVTTNPSSFLRSRSRVEVAAVSHGRGGIDRGALFYQDLTWVFGRLTLDGRLVVFDTGSFDSGLYEYEDDVRGSFSTPVLYGRGIRSYVLLSWHCTETMQLGAKYASTLRDGVRTMGSGYDEIGGDNAGTVSIQLDIRL